MLIDLGAVLCSTNPHITAYRIYFIEFVSRVSKFIVELANNLQ